MNSIGSRAAPSAPWKDQRERRRDGLGGWGRQEKDADDSSPRTLAEKLDYLFRQVHGRDRAEYSYREVAAGIEKAGGPTVSPTYLMYLRKGERTNPTLQHLEALAGFFGVPTTYFLDDKAARQITEELALLSALRDARVRSLALRLGDLTPEGLRAVRQMVEELQAEPRSD